MRIIITTVQSPFIKGGAEELAKGLCKALNDAGHEADICAMPFRFFPPQAVKRSMDVWSSEDLAEINNYKVDRMIGLKFPAYLAPHPDKMLWVLHQHRDVYDCADLKGDASARSPDWLQLQKSVRAADERAFSESRQIYTISQTVADRIDRHNGHNATALYHPPPNHSDFHCEAPLPYIFMPSRFEELKRQELLIEAMRKVKSPVKALLAGTGGQLPRMKRLVAEHGISDKVAFLGQISHREKVAYYARSLGVFFGPHNEDYGYVTLEAMLSAKPVITCRDSGGPTEFVRHGETGTVCDPEPEAVADAIENLYASRERAARMGENGLEHYRDMDISWEKVVDRLTANQSDC